ncbi:MAG: acyl carrier protein, partial [Chloroflexota bacterium]
FQERSALARSLVPPASPASPASPAAVAAPAFRARWTRAPERKRRDLLRAHLSEQLARVLGFDPAARIDPTKGFLEMGMDSLLALQFRNHLESTLGEPLNPVALYDFPTVDALASHLAASLAAAAAASGTELVGATASVEARGA